MTDMTLERIAASINNIRDMLDECAREFHKLRTDPDGQSDIRLGVYAGPEADHATYLMEQAFLACIALCESAGLSTLLDEVKADYAEAKRADFLKHVAWDEGVDLVWGQRIGLILGSIEKGLGAPDKPVSVQTDSGVKVGGNQPASTVSSSVEKPEVRPDTAQDVDRIEKGLSPTFVTPPAMQATEQQADLPLNGRQQDCLIAMLEKDVLESDSRMTADEIATAATGGDGDSIKPELSPMVNAGLLCSKIGRGGGYWLTEKGKTRAKSLSRKQ